MNCIRNRLLLDRPALSEPAKGGWEQLEHNRRKRSYRERRNSLVHGSQSADPRFLKRGVESIEGALNAPELLEGPRVRVRFGDAADTQVQVARVLIPHTTRSGSRAGAANPVEVAEWSRWGSHHANNSRNHLPLCTRWGCTRV
jgi:hypothetical protein